MTKIGVGVIIFKEGKVLLGKRLSKHGNKTWSFPGGHLEENETLSQCAIRETKEETGLEISNIVCGPWTNDIFEKSEERYLTLFTLAEYKGGVPILLEPDKFAEWKWFDWEELPNPLFKSIQNLLEQGFDRDRLLNYSMKFHKSISDNKLSGIQLDTQYKIVSFDMDGTIILNTTSTLHYAELLGVRKDVEELEDNFQKGLIDSTEFMKRISIIMKELNLKMIKDNLHTLPIIGGLTKTIKTLNDNGIITVIVTTSGQAYAEAIREKYGFQYAHGTQFKINSNGYIGEGIKVCSSAEKIRYVKALAKEHQVSLDRVAAIGDSVSDIPLFTQVGLPIALNYDDCLIGKAKVYIRTYDISDILPHIFTPRLASEVSSSNVKAEEMNDRLKKNGLSKVYYMQFLRKQLNTLSSHDLCSQLIHDFDNTFNAIFNSNIFLKILPDDLVRISALLLNQPLKCHQYKKIAEKFNSDRNVCNHFGISAIHAINESILFYISLSDKTVSEFDLINISDKSDEKCSIYRI
jgi:8-oxo-dGTP diphosphatase